METRAHHLLIGAFMLIMVGFLVGFFLWVAKVDLDKTYVEYDIYFEESVAGLSNAGDVRYNGVRVGQVVDIRLAPKNPSQVLVTVKIESDVPVLEDSVAVLSLQGLTGVAFVLIEGGSPGASPLKKKEGQERPVIQSRVSPIQEFFVGGPDLINEALRDIASLNDLLNVENREHVHSILAHVDDLSGGLAAQTENVGATIDELKQAIRDLRRTADAVTSLSNSAGGLINEDMKPAITDLRATIKAADGLIQNLDQVVEESHGGVVAFTNNTLPEIGRLVTDARRLAITLADLAQRLEENPGELIFQRPKPEQELK